MLDPQGNVRSDEEVQEMIRETIARHGRFILSAGLPPTIGSVETWAGLPFRVVRYVTYEEAVANDSGIWGSEGDWDPNDFHFEVEVAD